MGNKVTAMITLTDLNDALISGTAPTNPTVGTLWIDSSGPKNVLKKWTGSAWEAQPLDLEQLDPVFTEHVSEGVATALLNLGNLSSDDKVTASERQLIADKLVEILGTVPSGTTALPAVATVNTYTNGEYYQARKAATDAGVSTLDSTYTALAAAYTTFQTYLNGITETGSYLWDVSTGAKDKVHTIVGTTFRSNWQAFYNALLNLQTRTAKRTAEVKTETEAYTKSYRSQLVANGYGDLASNRNFGGFVYDTAQKVSGPGSFRRATTGETVTEEFIRVESDRTYRLAISLMNSTTSNTHNIGIECFNAAGTTLGKRHLLRTAAGSVALPSTTSWVHYEGVIGGVSAGAGVTTDRTFPAGTTQVKIWFNLNIGGVANNAFIGDVSFALEQIEANKDYNGISMSADKGLVVESTRNTTTMSATKGIEIKRKSDNANVFSVDANTGDLNITGNITMTGGQIAWDVLNKPTAQQVGAATPDQVSTAVKNITLGGRNYLRNSARLWESMTITSNSAYGVYDSALDYMFEQLVGKEITFSLDLKVDSTDPNPTVRLYGTNGSPKYTFGSTNFNVTTEWQRYTHTTTVSKNDNLGQGRIEFYGDGKPLTTKIYVKNVKVEIGNKATDWNPAPEDTQSQLDDFKTLTDKKGTTTVINGTMIQSGMVKGDFLDAKNLVVRDGSNNETLKVDSAGNVTINGVVTIQNGSNVYTKIESNTAVKNSTDTAFAADQGLAMKIGYSTYATATASNIYFHGFNWDAVNSKYVAADVNGKMLGADNITFVTLNKGRLNLSAGVPAGSMGFIVYDSGTYWYVVWDKTTGVYTKYNSGVTGHATAYTFSTNSHVVGELEM